MSGPKTPNRRVISVAVNLRNSGDHEALQSALNDLVQNDPMATAAPATADGSTVIHGMTESHLEEICDRISREYKIEIDTGRPEVVYLETIRKPAEAEGKYIRQVGGSGNYGHCKLRIEPSEPNKGYEFINAISNGSVPGKHIQSIDQGVQEAAELGILAGYPLVDVKVTLYHGSYHETDSNEMAFKFAGAIALRQAARMANPVLLEPMMAVEVTVPEERAGTIIGDINARRGRIHQMEQVGDRRFIKSIVPLAETLRSSMHGRLNFPMRFVGFEAAPRGGQSGDDRAGVPAQPPKGPKSGSGFAAASFEK